MPALQPAARADHAFPRRVGPWGLLALAGTLLPLPLHADTPPSSALSVTAPPVPAEKSLADGQELVLGLPRDRLEADLARAGVSCAWTQAPDGDAACRYALPALGLPARWLAMFHDDRLVRLTSTTRVEWSQERRQSEGGEPRTSVAGSQADVERTCRAATRQSASAQLLRRLGAPVPPVEHNVTDAEETTRLRRETCDAPDTDAASCTAQGRRATDRLLFRPGPASALRFTYDQWSGHTRRRTASTGAEQDLAWSGCEIVQSLAAP